MVSWTNTCRAYRFASTGKIYDKLAYLPHIIEAL
jgi:hypothetical protein